jgi:hypothetical protein
VTTSPSLAELADKFRKARQQFLSLKVDIAAARFARALAHWRHVTKAGFRVDQPRVPEGQPGGGQWTDGITPISRVRGPLIQGRIYGQRILLTPSQAAQLAQSQLRASNAIARIREREPNWQPPSQLIDPTNPASVIRSLESTARAAEARLRDLERPGMGHNRGPGLAPEPFTPLRPPAPSDLIATYRPIVGMHSDAFGRVPPRDFGTVAHTRIDNQDYFGVNSDSPAHTQRDQDLAMRMRDRLIAERPDVMQTFNKGWMPNDAAFHAEANLLLRAADANGGTLFGRSLEITVDRRFCDRCERVFPLIAERLGNPQISIRDSIGRTFEIRNGAAYQR